MHVTASNSQRVVCDHVAAVCGRRNVDVNNKQLSSCSNARHRYRLFIDDQKKEQVTAACAGTRKAVNSEVQQLKKKDLETDKESLLTSADEFAEKADKQHNVSFITKSDALRKIAEEEDSQLKLVDQQLTDRPLQLSNCKIANMPL